MKTDRLRNVRVFFVFVVLISCLTSKLASAESKPASQPLRGGPCSKLVKETLDAALDQAILLPAKGIEADKPPSYASDLGFSATHLVPDIVAYYGVSGCWDGAQAALARVRRSEGWVEAAALLSVQMATAGIFDNAIRLAEELPRGPWRDDANYRVAEDLIKSGQIEEAREILGKIPPSGPYEHLNDSEMLIMEYRLPHLIATGPVAEAEKYAAEELGRQRSGLKIFLLMADAYFASGDRRRWAEYVRKAELAGLRDRADAYEYYAKWKQMKKAHRSASRIRESGFKVQALISLGQYVKSSDIAQARQYLGEARNIAQRCQGSEECRFDAGRVAEGYASIRDYGTALRIVNEAYPDNTVDTQSLRSIALTNIILQQAKNKDLPEARHALGLLPSWSLDGGREPIAVAEARRGDFKAALDTTKKIGNEAIIMTVITAVAALDPPTDVIRQWLEFSRSLKSRWPRGRTYQVLLAALARAGQTELAKEFIAAESSGLPRARGLLGIAQGLLQLKPGDNWLKIIKGGALAT